MLLLALTSVLAGVDVDAAIVALLPEAPPLAMAPQPTTATAAEHAAALRNQPGHGDRFWVRGVSGDPEARRVVFLIPQFHRNVTMPIAWTTLGREISEVQESIDLLVRVLATGHGLSCIGTEGTSRRNVPYSSELRQLAWWRRELERGRAATLAELRADAGRAEAAIDTTERLLARAIGQHAVYLDGVGAAQSRLAGTVDLVRFGIEEDGTHDEAMALLEELKRIEEEIATIDPGSEPEEAGVIGKMWLDEYPEYQTSTLEPLAGALLELERLRRELRRDGLGQAARALAVWMARVRRIADALVQPAEVASTIAYYRELDGLAAAAGSATTELPVAQRRRRSELRRRQRDTYGRYHAVTRERREQVAAVKVIERMTGTRHRRCGVVMGAGHEDGLARELIEAARVAGLGSVGVVTVAPYHFE